jgi:hypothetical protein
MKKYLLLFVFTVFLTSYISAQIITTIAGGNDSIGNVGDGGPALSGRLYHPYKVALDGRGNMFIADRDHNRIRKVDAAGNITTVAGNGSVGYSGDNGPATNAGLNSPFYVAVDFAGNVYIPDTYNNRVRKVNPSGIISTIAGTGTAGYNGDNIPATDAQLNIPSAIALDNKGNIYITDADNTRIRKISIFGIITTVAGTGAAGFSGDGGLAIACQLNNPYGLTFDFSGNLFFADLFNHRVRKIDLTGIITTVAGSDSGGYSGDGGPATNAKLMPLDVAADKAGNLYIPDGYGNHIRIVHTYGIINDLAGTGFSGFSGDGGIATLAELNAPSGVTADSMGNLYIADFGNDRIRFITSTEEVPAYTIPQIISLFPNPSHGDFVLNIPSLIDEPANITITTMDGVKIMDFPGVTNKPIHIKIADHAGIYSIVVTTTHGSANAKLIILP